MGLKIIVGAQFGGEGKGKVAYQLSKENNIHTVVRVGGSNSGHTVIHDNQKYIFRHLPTASLLENRISILGAGTYIDLDVLKQEIELSKIDKRNLLIDFNAVVLQSKDKEEEINNDLKNSIGSTLSGTGMGVKNRILRKSDAILAKNCKDLESFLTDTKTYLRAVLDKGEDIILEGTQGYGLSLLHSPYYPYTTSRDTTAAGFLSEIGLSPFDVDDIYLVIRTYPIRVEGNSGPLKYEIDWETLGQEVELTSVTKGKRRVAKIDYEIIKEAISVNRPTKIVLNHLDYVEENLREEFVEKLESKIKIKVDFIGLSNKEIVSR